MRHHGVRAVREKRRKAGEGFWVGMGGGMPFGRHEGFPSPQVEGSVQGRCSETGVVARYRYSGNNIYLSAFSWDFSK